MLALVRASLTAALVIFSSNSAFSADKPYHRDDLAEAAVRLEGQIKADSGTVAKPLAALRRDADTAFARNDQKGGMRILGQIVALAPGDTASWLRLSRAIL
jgi:alpha-2-macroglobulin